MKYTFKVFYPVLIFVSLFIFSMYLISIFGAVVFPFMIFLLYYMDYFFSLIN